MDTWYSPIPNRKGTFGAISSFRYLRRHGFVSEVACVYTWYVEIDFDRSYYCSENHGQRLADASHGDEFIGCSGC